MRGMHILVVDWKFRKFTVKQTKRKKNLVSKHTLIPLHNWTIFCFCIHAKMGGATKI